MKTETQESGNTTLPAKLPTIEELYDNDELPTLYKESKFLVLVNQEPKPGWVKEHPIHKIKVGNKTVGMPYIPIERIEWLLTNIFIKWRVDVKSVQMIANSVVVCIRLHYYNWLEKEWYWQDGVGAAPLQTDKDAGAINWDRIKSSAVQMSAPAAESYAIKDAAEKIGKMFGKDLNRKDQITYEHMGDRFAGKFDEEQKTEA